VPSYPYQKTQKVATMAKAVQNQLKGPSKHRNLACSAAALFATMAKMPTRVVKEAKT